MPGIKLNAPLEINAPSPVRTTDVVGIDWIYATKEDIPTGMRFEGMRTMHMEAGHADDKQEFRLEDGIEDSNWTEYGGVGETEVIPFGYNVRVYSNQSYRHVLANPYDVLKFNTIPLQVILDKAGTWKLTAFVYVECVAAEYTSGGSTSLNLRLVRTNNTAIEIPNAGLTGLDLPDMSSPTTLFIGAIPLQNVMYTTSNADDIISIKGEIGVAPDNGHIRVYSAYILAEFLY